MFGQTQTSVKGHVDRVDTGAEDDVVITLPGLHAELMKSACARLSPTWIGVHMVRDYQSTFDSQH